MTQVGEREAVETTSPRACRQDRAVSRKGRWHGEAIIADTLKRGPEVEFESADGRWRFSRWRQFVGSYSLPALPDPLFVVQLAGKTNVRTWDRDGWSEATSFPGAATIVPSALSTRWLVDGELDVVTFSVDSDDLRSNATLEQFASMRFAFADPLGTALARQILAELYKPASNARNNYVTALIEALRAHMMRGPANIATSEFPTSAFSSYRIHKVLDAINQRPEADHSLEELSDIAGITPSHFCRVFKRATGHTPHRYVLKARLERAQQILEHSDSSIGAIAEALGFTSQSHFNRAFRSHFGEAPNTFRKRWTSALLM